MMALNPGDESVEHIFSGMQIDRAWSIREEQDFTWWPGELAQRVWVEPPRRGPAGDVFEVRAETYVLRDVVPSGSVTELAALVNAHSPLSALVYDEDDRSLRYACSMVIHEQNVAWAKSLLSLAVAMQPADAVIALDQAEVLGGVPAVSAHPENGFRTVRDDMINVISQSVAPHGSAESPFSAADLSEIERLETSPLVLTSGGVDSLTGEFPFYGIRSGVDVASRVGSLRRPFCRSPATRDIRRSVAAASSA